MSDPRAVMLFAARKLVKSYAAGRPGCSATVRVLDGVNLELAPGGIVGITGRRGSGKTTLVRCAAGLARPDAGALHWHPTARRSRVVALAAPAYAFETAHDVMHRACIEPTVDRDRLLALLDDLDLTSRLQAPQSALTTDERARFAIAVGLARRHPLVLLDGTADALARESLPLTTALLTRHCAEGGAVLVTGRDATAVRALAVDVRTLSDGRLQLPAPAADPPSVARVAEPHSTAAVR